MRMKSLVTAAGASALGLLIAAAPLAAAPIEPSTAGTAITTESLVVPAATVIIKKGPPMRVAPRVVPRVVPRFTPRIAPRVIPQGPRIAPRVIPQGPRIAPRFIPGPRVVRIRPGFFRPGRTLWVLPAIGAAAFALTLAPGWYWGDYYDECLRWIYPCPGCEPRLVDLCADYGAPY